MAEAVPSIGQHKLEVGEQAREKSQILKKQRHDDDLVSLSVAKPWPGWPGESVFRMLIPAHKAGIVIGKKGEFIRKMVEETRARIKILDAPPGSSERVVMVSAKEEPDSSVPPAIDGLLRVHKCVVGFVEGDNSHTPSGVAGKVSTRLLIAATQSGVVIGKQGGAVKSIMEASNCVVRVLGAEGLPGFALQDDRVVEVVGDPVGVHKAVELIASQLRKFLVDRSVMPLFEMQTPVQNSQIEHTRPPQSHIAAQGFSANGSPDLNSRPNSHYIPPSQHHDSDLWNASCQTRVQNSQIEHTRPLQSRGAAQGFSANGSPDLNSRPNSHYIPPSQHLDSDLWNASCQTRVQNSQIEYTRPPQSRGAAQGFSANGSAGLNSRPDSLYISPSQHHDSFYSRETAPPWQHDSFYSSHDMDPPMDKQFHHGISTYGRNPPPLPSSAVITQVTQLMQIPLTYADAVIGTAGANVSYIRRTSGATVTIQESKAVLGEMAVEINGSAAQVQTAQQLIQNFMAEAASSAQTQVEGASDPVYASYASHSSMYSSSPPNTGHAAHVAGGYGSGSVYGTAKYGY